MDQSRSGGFGSGSLSGGRYTGGGGGPYTGSGGGGAYTGGGGTMSGMGVSGSAYDRWVQPPEDKSPLDRAQQQYWTTKQNLLRRFGRKEDDCVVASDSVLDAKLEMYRSINDTCRDLDRILGFYQEQLCVLSQEENALGRFLKEQGREDKTRAGKMMIAVGKTMSYTAQQRLALRVPLARLNQEVETFHERAVRDTYMTVRSMEKSRNEYRGALMWMKDISQQLDPDTGKQLERFRKVQTQVKKNKQRFDKLKLDCLQKVDLLAASRCNMFSHSLVLYQNSLLHFWEKTARTMKHVADSFKGYQYYEFSVVRELCEPSRQLANQTSGRHAEPSSDNSEPAAEGGAPAGQRHPTQGPNGTDGIDGDQDLLFPQDELTEGELVLPSGVEKANDSAADAGQDDALLDLCPPTAQGLHALASSSGGQDALLGVLRPPPPPASFVNRSAAAGNGSAAPYSAKAASSIAPAAQSPRTNATAAATNQPNKPTNQSLSQNIADLDLLTSDADFDSERALLEQILSTPTGPVVASRASTTAADALKLWSAAALEEGAAVGATNTSVPLEDLFGGLAMGGAAKSGSAAGVVSLSPESQRKQSAFLPSQLLSTGGSVSGISAVSSPRAATSAEGSTTGGMMPSSANSSAAKSKPRDMSAWFDLFADLDPLANPDAVDNKQKDQDRSC